MGKAGIQQGRTPIPHAGISGAQFGIPQERTIRLDTQQRVVAALAAILGVVTDLGSVLMAEHRYDRAIEVKDQAGAVFRPVDELLQQSIIDAMQLFPQKRRCME